MRDKTLLGVRYKATQYGTTHHQEATMDPVNEKFGVELKARRDKEEKAQDVSSSQVNRAKASVYAWDDDRLQSTAVVKKKITKAAITVQRFIRACISHWEYFNQYKAPLVEELKDIERRRHEELEEVRVFLMRGFEEARLEIESELALPQEQFELLKKTTDGLKKEIKEEEEEAVNIEMQINEQKHETRRLEKEKHELEASQTLSRLDVEIPALEAERMEMEGAAAEFEAIVKQLKLQHDEMVTGAEIERKHKARLMRCLAAIVQLLEKREVKTKIIQSVKMSIKYKGEPPPKPATAPEPQTQVLAASEAAAVPTTESLDARSITPTEEAKTHPMPSTSTPSDEKQKGKETKKDPSKLDSSSSGSSSSSSSSSSDPTKGKSSKRTNNLRASANAASSKKDNGRRSSTTSTKSTKSKSPKDKKSTSIDDSEAVFNWGEEAKRRASRLMVREASRRFVRSLSPVEKDKRNKGGGSNKVQRSKSDDLDSLAAAVGRKGRKLPQDAFDWSSMAIDDSVNKDKRSKKDKSKKKKKDKDKEKSSKKSGKRDSVSTIGTEGVFKFAYER